MSVPMRPTVGVYLRDCPGERYGRCIIYPFFFCQTPPPCPNHTGYVIQRAVLVSRSRVCRGMLVCTDAVVRLPTTPYHTPPHVSLCRVDLHQMASSAVPVPCVGLQEYRISQRSFGQSAAPILGRRSPSSPPMLHRSAQTVLLFLGRHSQVFAPGLETRFKCESDPGSYTHYTYTYVGSSVLPVGKLNGRVGVVVATISRGSVHLNQPASLPAATSYTSWSILSNMVDTMFMFARFQCGSCLPEL